MTNSNREEKKVAIAFAAGTNTFQSAEDLWGGQKIAQNGQQWTMIVPPRDAVVLSLR